MPRIRHNTDPVCPLCEQKLETAEESLAEWFRQIKKEFPDCHISCAYRGREEQEAAFEAGTTAAHFPHSKHNSERDGVPCAEALDLFQLKEGKAVFKISYYKEIAEFSVFQGFPIRWPTRFVSRGRTKTDGPHFEFLT